MDTSWAPGRGRAGWILLASGFLASHPAAGQVAPTYDEGIFEVYVERLPTRIIVTTLVDGRGEVLLPLVPILEQVGIPVRAEGDLYVLEWPPGEWRTVVDVANRTVAVGNETRTAPPEDWVRVGGQLYLQGSILADVLDARVDVDWAGLGIVISENPEFPATRRLEREAQQARERLMVERLSPRLPDLPFSARSGGAVGTWSVTMVGAEGASRATVRSAVGGSVLGGAIEVGGALSAGGASEETFDEGYARFSRVFPRASLVRQIQVGHVLTDGPLSRRITGITLTNEPYTTPRYFADVLIQPSVPAGWEYEVYQGETLVGIVPSGVDPGNIRAPLNYGNTPVRIRMIGPAGQERVEELLYVVPPSRLPVGELRYNAGLGSCSEPACRSYAYADVRRGLSQRLTAGLGVDRLDPEDGPVEVRPWAYAGLTAAQRVNLDVQVQPGSFFQGGIGWANADNGALGASYAWNRPPGDAPTLEAWSAQLTGTAQVTSLGGRTVSARLQLRGTDVSTTDSWQAFVTTSIRRSYVSADVESGLQERRFFTVRTFTPLQRSSTSVLRDLAVSAGLGVTHRGPELLELGASFRPTSTGSMSVDLRLRRGSSPVLGLSYAMRRPQGYFQGRAGTGRGAGLFLSGDGGVAYDGETGVVPLVFRSLGRAGVRGRVFHDTDGDGVQGDGDSPAVGVDVLVETERVTTDASGAFLTWDIRPYDVLSIAVDSLSVDPSWVPAPREVFLRPSPNLFNEVHLPLVRTREVVGRVELGGSEPRSLAGVRVELRDPTGSVVAEERTFSDGVFYFQRITPGRYTLAVARSSLEALSVTAEPDPVVVVVAPGTNAPVDVPLIRVDPGA